MAKKPFYLQAIGVAFFLFMLLIITWLLIWPEISGVLLTSRDSLATPIMKSIFKMNFSRLKARNSCFKAFLMGHLPQALKPTFRQL